MKSFSIIVLFTLLAFASASVTTKSAVHKKKDAPLHEVHQPGYQHDNTEGEVFLQPTPTTAAGSSRSLSKDSVKVEEIGTQAEISFKDSQVNDNTGMNLKKTDRLDLQTSSRATCGQFSRCNLGYSTRCWRANSTIWYVRWFLISGNCNGKIYISGRRVCIRGSGYQSCCATMYYLRA